MKIMGVLQMLKILAHKNFMKKTNNDKYIQTDEICCICDKKIDFLIKFEKKQEKNLKEWLEFYNDGLLGIKYPHNRPHEILYCHGKCCFEKIKK